MAEAVLVDDLSRHEKESPATERGGEERREARETRHHANKYGDENTAYFSRADARVLLISLVKATGSGDYSWTPCRGLGTVPNCKLMRSRVS
jgi:hypothetical protein